MELEALPAAKGDCLLLYREHNGKPYLIVIDGGPSGTYRQQLKPRLLDIREKRIARGLLADDQPLRIDLAIISHIDDDHINGVLALLEDIADKGAPFRVGRLWHNSFRSIVDAEIGQVGDPTPVEAATTASVSGAALGAMTGGGRDRRDLAKILASVGQGYDVLGVAKKLGCPVNPDFNYKTIEATDGTAMSIDGLSIRVLGPRKTELDALRKDFKAWLAKPKSNRSPASLLASMSDKSVANLSSIVLLVEGDGQKFLLTGDALGKKFMQSTADFGLLDEAGQLPVDLFKVPHHGSDRNNDVACFKMFPASRYVFSGNGEHGNPERATLDYLATARGTAPTTVQLTYTPAQIDQGRAGEWAKHHKTMPFDVATQGIEPYLAGHPILTVQAPRA